MRACRPRKTVLLVFSPRVFLLLAVARHVVVADIFVTNADGYGFFLVFGCRTSTYVIQKRQIRIVDD